jgi:type IV pilus assembly protein PilO
VSTKPLNLRDLDINNIGSWPQNAKIGFCALLSLLIIALAWWLFVSGKRTELETLQGQETDLRAQFETKQGRAANLGPLKQQLAATDAAPAPEQNRDARPDRRHLADSFGHGHQQ